MALSVIRKFILFLFGLLLAFPALAGSVDNVRFGPRAEGTRIVFDLSAPTAFNTQTLSAPPRLVVDFEPGTTYTGSSEVDRTGIVTRARFGVPDSQKSRIVLDLSQDIEIVESFALPPSASQNARVVIDVKPGAPILPQENMPAAAAAFREDNVVVIKGALPPPPEEKPDTLAAEPTGLNNVLIAPPPEFAFDALPTAKPSWLASPTGTGVKKYVVYLDAGHGGRDPGSLGVGNIREKDIVLSLAKTLQAQLNATGRYDARLTRTGDYYIQLRERFQSARADGADMFISLHADKIHIPSVRGASVYTLSETASDKETARLARQENNAGVIAGVDLAVEDNDVANILLDLARRETLNESKLFAELFVDKMRENDIRTLTNPHRFAGFAVLKAPDIPSVLVEAGFLSNDRDTALLKNSAYRARFADALHKAIDSFFDRIERLGGE